MNEVNEVKKVEQQEENKEIVEETKKENKDTLNNAEKNTTTDKQSTKAMAGFILGSCSIIAFLLPFQLIGYPVAILGIIFSAMGLKSKKRNWAVVGLILSIFFLVLTLLNIYFATILDS